MCGYLIGEVDNNVLILFRLKKVENVFGFKI